MEGSLIFDSLISPFTIELPKSILDSARSLAKALHETSESPEYQKDLPGSERLEKWPKTPSVLHCIDMHYSPDMGLKVIEVNSNAALYLTTQVIYEALGVAGGDPGLVKLKESFQEAFQLKDNDRFQIVDETPEKQGLFFEFLLYQEWFEKLGYTATIEDTSTLSAAAKIYNRDTDFYLETDRTKTLSQAYFEQKTLVSPNPRGYYLMADKKHLAVLRKHLPENLQSMIPESKLFGEFESKEELWKVRKKYFFKPSQSFGSKGVFSGKGISKSAFEKLYDPNYMAQELCPADKRDFEYSGETHTMKYDLRFFIYKGEVQNWVARLYQGQATNMRTDLGGLAPIRWI